MEIERLEEFFRLYLKRSGLEYDYDDKVYTVELDKVHKSRFDQDRLVVTFDMQTSKDKGITLLGIGSYIFDSMHNEFADSKVFSVMQSSGGIDELNAANEKIDEIKDDSDTYKVDLKEVQSVLATIRIFVSTSKQKKTYLKNVLYCNKKVYRADNIDFGGLDASKDAEADTALLKDAIRHIEKDLDESLQDEIKELESEHEEEIKRLVDIQEEHGQDQYAELQEKEEDMLYRIKDLEDKMLNASNFDSRRNYADKIKSAKKRYEKFVEKNKEKKDKVKESFSKERGELNLKGFDITSDILVLIQIKHVIYPIRISDKDYMFIPLIDHFKESKQEK